MGILKYLGPMISILIPTFLFHDPCDNIKCLVLWQQKPNRKAVLYYSLPCAAHLFASHSVSTPAYRGKGKINSYFTQLTVNTFLEHRLIIIQFQNINYVFICNRRMLEFLGRKDFLLLIALYIVAMPSTHSLLHTNTICIQPPHSLAIWFNFSHQHSTLKNKRITWSLFVWSLKYLFVTILFLYIKNYNCFYL